VVFMGNVAAEPACAHCETQTALYGLTATDGYGNQVIQTVCRFCYIRLVGKRPPRRLRVGGPAVEAARG
jgi:hypothetical protein